MYKKKYKYICVACFKEKESIDPNKLVCVKCKKKNRPGKGQLKLIQ